MTICLCCGTTCVRPRNVGANEKEAHKNYFKSIYVSKLNRFDKAVHRAK